MDKNLWFFCVCGLIISSQADGDVFPYKGNKHDIFDWKLFNSLASSTRGNVVSSPFSIKLLLSVLAEAATSATKDELLSVLPDVSGNEALQLYTNVVKSLEEKHEKYTLNIGSKIYVNPDLKPTEEFINVAKSSYHVSLENVKFSNPESASVINNWCSNVTNGKIDQLVKADDIKDYQALLVNALYFNGTWEQIFSEEDTLPGIFQLNSGKRVQPEFMLTEGQFYYLDDDKLQASIVRLPYKGGKFSMTLVLPNDIVGLDQLIVNINPNKLQQVQQQMKKVNVMVEIPKFQFETSLHLNKNLEALGIKNIFSNNAKFPKLGDNLKVSDVIQKAGVVINERGAELSAASSIGIGNRFGRKREVFHANHPFLFFVEDETTGALLFTGKVVDPTE